MQALWNFRSPQQLSAGFLLWSQARRKDTSRGLIIPPLSHPRFASTHYWIHLVDGRPYIEQGEAGTQSSTLQTPGETRHKMYSMVF